MTWAEFTEAVDDHLATDATRRGLEAFRDRYLRNAAIDLQRFIPKYREGNTTIYTKTDVVDKGHAQLVAFPEGARPKAVYMFSTDADADPQIDRYRLDFYPWEKRQDMLDGRLNFFNWWNGFWNASGQPCQNNPVPNVTCANPWKALRRRMFVYSVGPHGKNFLIYPPLDDHRNLLLVWDGIKTSFSDGDTVAFDDEAAESCADYIRWKVVTFIDRNPSLGMLAKQDYIDNRRKLYRDWQETQSMEEKDEEYDSDAIPPPTNFSGFGAQTIPLLNTVTQLAGTDNTALAALPTAGIASADIPLTVMIRIAGVNQIWTLADGTDATGMGVQRPNDYDAATNARVWYQTIL